MNKSIEFEKLVGLARGKYHNGDPAHDFAHILRVVETAKRLGEAERANLDVLLPAALLHDVVNVPKNHPDRVRASELAALEARKLLVVAGYGPSEIEQIATAILEHSYSLGKAPSLLESAILQDADRLDALGAIGLLRMVTVGAKLGRTFYSSEDPFARARELDDKQFTIDHFGTKLFKLAEKMNTPVARAEAERRTAYMRAFLTQLEGEI